jgi:hypothetical protein
MPSSATAARGMMRAAEIARQCGIPHRDLPGFQWATVDAPGASADCGCRLHGMRARHAGEDHHKLRDLLGVDDLGGTINLGSYVRAQGGSRSGG